MDTSRINRLILGVFIVFALCSCSKHAGQYFSKVTMEVKSDQTLSSFSREAGQHEQSGPTTERFLPCKEILYPVIDNLKLCDAWARPGELLTKEKAYQRLVERIEIKNIPTTDLEEIGVYDVDPREAANIANSIAVIYINKCKDDQEALMDSGIMKLEQEVTDQRKVVDQLRTDAAQRRNEKGTADPNPEKMIADESAEAGEYPVAKRKYLDAKAVLQEAENRLSELRMKIQNPNSLVRVRIFKMAEPADRPVD